MYVRTILVKVNTTLARDIGLGAMSRAVTNQSRVIRARVQSDSGEFSGAALQKTW